MSYTFEIIVRDNQHKIVFCQTDTVRWSRVSEALSAARQFLDHREELEYQRLQNNKGRHSMKTCIKCGAAILNPQLLGDELCSDCSEAGPAIDEGSLTRQGQDPSAKRMG